MNNQIPAHIAFILDGNRRWAKEQGLPAFSGHAAGLKRAKEIIDYAHRKGIKVITMYCFSIENWNRSEKEVNYLMQLFNSFITKNIDEFNEKGFRLIHLGRQEELPKTLAKNLQKAMDQTKNNDKMVVQLAINYTSRDEINRAVERLVNNDLQITVENITDNLDTAGQPDPDLIIRTSGEQRLSGFLLWQAAYSEFYFSKVHWPAFTPAEFDNALAEYKERQRRFGGD